MAEYSKRDIAKMLGRSHRNITYWTDFGLVIPDIQPSQGRGIARVYSDRNLIEFSMIDVMVKYFGISLDSIQYILRILRDGKTQKPTGGLLGNKEKWEKRKKGIIEYKEQNFNDFYQNPEWGTSKELLYIEEIFLAYDIITEEERKVTPDNPYLSANKSFYVVDLGFDFNEIFKIELMLESYKKLLWLGNIKDAALNKVGLKSPPFEGRPFEAPF